MLAEMNNFVVGNCGEMGGKICLKVILEAK